MSGQCTKKGAAVRLTGRFACSVTQSVVTAGKLKGKLMRFSKWIVGKRLCRELEVHHEYTCVTAGVVMGRMATTICKAAKQNLGGRKKLQQLAFQA